MAADNDAAAIVAYRQALAINANDRASGRRWPRPRWPGPKRSRASRGRQQLRSRLHRHVGGHERLPALDRVAGSRRCAGRPRRRHGISRDVARGDRHLSPQPSSWRPTTASRPISTTSSPRTASASSTTRSMPRPPRRASAPCSPARCGEHRPFRLCRGRRYAAGSRSRPSRSRSASRACCMAAAMTSSFRAGLPSVGWRRAGQGYRCSTSMSPIARPSSALPTMPM